MIHFVLCGHGSYGSSVKESMDMFLPEPIDVTVIDFPRHMDAAQLTEKVRAVLEEKQDEPVLFICDLFGGAPFKICAIETLNYPNKGVIAGINISSILEICFMRDLDLKSLMVKAKETTLNTVGYYPE